MSKVLAIIFIRPYLDGTYYTAGIPIRKSKDCRVYGKWKYEVPQKSSKSTESYLRGENKNRRNWNA